MYDICVVGGGPSGLMAAISASYFGKKVLLIEQNSSLAQKLLLSGGGRCNVTNNCSIEELIQNIPQNGKFLYSVFNQFNNQDIIHFFDVHNNPLIQEDHGRMFPQNNSAQSIIDTLYNVAKKNGVIFLMDSKVCSIDNQNNLFTIKTSDNQKEIRASKVILCCGGQSYPQTGSDGSGYRLAKHFDHHISDLYPCEASLYATNPLPLSGISFNDATLEVCDTNQKKYLSITHDVLFTHFGLSGPAALRCSGKINQLLKQDKQLIIKVYPNPQHTLQYFTKTFTNLKKQKPKQLVVNACKGIFPDRYLKELLKLANIELSQKMADLSNQSITKLAELSHCLPIPIDHTAPLSKSFVTGGGITLSEINPKTMESKCQNNLFFAGEIMDLQGYTGGFNITIALCSGYVAGYHAAID